MPRNKLQDTLIFKIFQWGALYFIVQKGCSSPAPYPTRLPLSWWYSAQATLQLPPATFFQFENPAISLNITLAGLNIALLILNITRGNQNNTWASPLAAQALYQITFDMTLACKLCCATKIWFLFIRVCMGMQYCFGLKVNYSCVLWI